MGRYLRLPFSYQTSGHRQENAMETTPSRGRISRGYPKRPTSALPCSARETLSVSLQDERGGVRDGILLDGEIQDVLPADETFGLEVVDVSRNRHGGPGHLRALFGLTAAPRGRTPGAARPSAAFRCTPSSVSMGLGLVVAAPRSGRGGDRTAPAAPPPPGGAFGVRCQPRGPMQPRTRATAALSLARAVRFPSIPLTIPPG